MIRDCRRKCQLHTATKNLLFLEDDGLKKIYIRFPYTGCEIYRNQCQYFAGVQVLVFETDVVKNDNQQALSN